MLSYPASTSRDEKLEIINLIKNKLLSIYKADIIAIGVYGSLALGNDGPFSDIEMHVVTKDGIKIKSYEFIYEKFKIEINTKQKNEFLNEAMMVDDSWAIRVGMFINILSIYDPNNFFNDVRKLPFHVPDAAIRETMREFMIWEPYETMAKIRNNYNCKNFNYLPLGAKDLIWQTSKLIGLANKQYYSTRARTFEESLKMNSKPSGYEELVFCVMDGKLNDKEYIYKLCEGLWLGLNDWYAELGIDYKVIKLPF